MPKNLLIIRHAKSSWDDPALSDRDRPLNHRGKRDAPLIGQALQQRGAIPDLIVTSPAVRARKTAKLLAAAVGYPNDRIERDERIYLKGVAALMEVITEFPEGLGRVFLIGHNPDLTELVNVLTDEAIANMPTCGAASVEFALDSWAHIGPGVGRLVFFDYPKRSRE